MILVVLLVSIDGKALAVTPVSWGTTSFAAECTTNQIIDVLSNFSSIYGVDLEVSDNVEGECYGWLKYKSVIDFLDFLSDSYGLSWYYYQSKLYISRNKDFEVARLSISAELHSAFRTLKLIEPKYGWSFLKGTEEVIVNGPLSYIDNIKRLINQKVASTSKVKNIFVAPKVNDDHGIATEDGAIFIIPVKHASVVDRNIVIRGTALTIPGIASVLNRVINGRAQAPVQKGENKGDLVKYQIKRVASIEADTRTNSIVIRSADRTKQYFESIISRLDKPLELIEIDAMIVDVNRETFFEIGMRYGYESSKKGNEGRLDALGDTTNNLSAILNIGDYAKFFADIKALEGKGEANIVANTSIVTIENQPALIDLSKTFYIRNVGERIANVTPVTTGTLLNITPQLLREEGAAEVQLIVNIEDGQVMDEVVDSIPIISRSQVNTKAIIEAGKSLVIGGYHLQRSESMNRSIPILGKIPLLKGLFTYKSRGTRSEERLFVLTPRISLKSHEPIKKIKSANIRNMISRSGSILGGINQRSNYAKIRVEQAAAMFEAIISSDGSVKRYAVNRHVSLQPALVCHAPNLNFEILGQMSYTSDGVTVYRIRVNNNMEGSRGVPENSCVGKGLIATVNTASRTLEGGQATYLLAALDNVMAGR